MVFGLLSFLGLRPSFRQEKCKRLLNTVMERIKLLRSRRQTQMEQLLIDVAMLLQLRKEEKAQVWIGRICKELSLLSAYNKISDYCECVRNNLDEISHKEICPLKLQEALEGLCFAASYCADLPELQEIREIFASKFGVNYVTAAQELDPGCHVNRQFSRCLCAKDVADQIKRDLLKEIIDHHKLKHNTELLSCEEEEDEDEGNAHSGMEQIQGTSYSHDSELEPSEQREVQFTSVNAEGTGGNAKGRRGLSTAMVSDEDNNNAKSTLNLESRKSVSECAEMRSRVLKRPCNRNEGRSTKNIRLSKSTSDESPPHRIPPPPPPPPLPPSQVYCKTVPPSRAPPPPISLSSIATSWYNKIADETGRIQTAVPSSSSKQVQYNQNYDGSHIHPKLPKYEDLVFNFNEMKKHRHSFVSAD
ncbi:hypothetical protein KP509_18G067400 [Ceratopteris richardii]|uniref:IST1-like protein n=1 Tax=Ceratopteris richardii TaxID=49495 RepID=A0A8T2SV56_CERRI|nr:hypothetical protein KP509_18G067400 [Ceratopteris richardii]